MSVNLEILSDEQLRELVAALEAHKRLETREEATNKFMAFVDHVYEGFITGRHHRIMADAFERIARGELKRLIINMPPRHTKSEFGSYMLPSWLMGRNPKLKVIQANHNTDLATRFGRKVRDLIDNPLYQEIFPGTALKEDSKSAGKWLTSQGGEYFAAGVGAAVTGRGADVFIIDDPHSEQDALSPTAFDDCYEWYTSGPRQRLQPGAAIVIIMTRWGKRDLTGRLLAHQASDILADQWEVIEFPAIMPSGRPLWPEFWEIEALLGVKASLPPHKWSAQWQQNPVASESVIVRREWWKNWPHEKVRNLKYIMQAYDTAFSSKDTANYSAITTWGIFEPQEDGVDHVILLDAVKDRWNFPQLKENARVNYRKWQPDMVLIEAKATGTPLADELMAQGIPVQTYSPGRGRDKISRMHMVTPLFEGGRVWASLDQKFAQDVIDEVSSFPAGENDDYCDTVTMALMRFRQGGFLRLETDEDDEEDDHYRRRRRRGQRYY
jgi:predicted phage terminase large subunit-like protein